MANPKTTAVPKSALAAAATLGEDGEPLTVDQLAEIAGVDASLLQDDPAKSRRVWVTVAKGQKGDLPYVSPAVNGRTIQIERGKKVAIPEAYLLAMQNQLEQNYDDQGNAGEESPAVNVQTHGYVTEQELAKLRTEGKAS